MTRSPLFIVVLVCVGVCDAFLPCPLQGVRHGHRVPPMMSKSAPNFDADVEFAKQELQIIFSTMSTNKINFKMLSEDQTNRIRGFVDTLLDQKLAVDGESLAKSGALIGKWKLEWSNEDRYRLLPPGVEVFNYIFDEAGGRLDNVLRFANSPFIRSIRAIANYKVDAQNRVVFLFKKIVVGIFGFYLPLPFFGDGGGYIELQYFDGDLWMEQFTESLQDGSTQRSVNVYRRTSTTLTETDKEQIIPVT